MEQEHPWLLRALAHEPCSPETGKSPVKITGFMGEPGLRLAAVPH